MTTPSTDLSSEPQAGDALPHPPTGEDSLDPSDWDEFRRVSHQMLDDMIDFHRSVHTRAPWTQMPAEIEHHCSAAAPRAGAGLAAAYQDFSDVVLPYPTGNIHPRFWGWVSGTGSPSGFLGDMLAAGINSIAGPFNDSSARVEQQVIDWMCEALGLVGGTSGVITSGGSVANLIGLAVGRDTIASRLGFDVPANGLPSADLILYTSTEVHSSVFKAAQILGLGRSSIRAIAVDDTSRIKPEALTEAIHRDRSAGLLPFAIVGNAGTVNTGAIDDLETLADIAEQENLWFHIDGAFGALARLAPALAAPLAGLERADSLAFDFHKWMYVPYEAGCVMVRDFDRREATFRVNANYLESLPRGAAAQPASTNLRSLQLSRGFKALKIWLLIKEHGLDLYGRLIERNVAQARYLADRVDDHDELELLAPVPLNVVCFRFRPRSNSALDLDVLNRELLMQLQERGLAVPSSTVLDGRFALRVAISNQRSEFDDFDFLIDHVIKLGRILETSQ